MKFSKVAKFLLIDPENPLHQEWVSQSDQTFKIIQPHDTMFQKMAHWLGLNPGHLLYKNTPSLLTLQDGLFYRKNELNDIAMVSTHIQTLHQKILDLFVQDNDLCFVFSEADAKLLPVMQFEGPLLQVDRTLAQKLDFKPNSFYCFHKKSVLNQDCPKVIEQLLYKKYDVFTPKHDWQQQLAYELKQNNNILSKRLQASVFDQLFERTFNVMYLAGTAEEFKTQVDDGDIDRPALLIEYYPSPEIYSHVQQLIKRLAEHDVFNVYAQPNRGVMLAKPKITVVDNGLKYRDTNIWFGQGMQESIDKFVDQFCDNELEIYFESQRQKGASVKELSANQFEQWVMDKSKTMCVIEITKKGCSACDFNQSIFNLVSSKLQQIGVELDTYKISIEQQLPYLGNYQYTPVFLFVKKEGAFITEIYTLPTPSSTGNNIKLFLSELQKKTRIRDITKVEVDLGSELKTFLFSI